MKTIVVTLQFEVDDEIDPTEDWVDWIITSRINTGEGWWANIGNFVGQEEFED